jgi:hypothetical protein
MGLAECGSTAVCGKDSGTLVTVAPVARPRSEELAQFFARNSSGLANSNLNVGPVAGARLPLPEPETPLLAMFWTIGRSLMGRGSSKERLGLGAGIAAPLATFESVP